MRSVEAMLRALLPLAVWVLVAAAGCTTKPAPVVEPPPPVLVMPVTPPRVLAPLPEATADASAAVEPEEKTPTPARPARPRPRNDAARDAGKPDARGEGAANPDAPPAEAAAPAKPAEPVMLRTPQTANDAEAERKIREVLARATRSLSQVNERGLGSDARIQFHSARRFIDQAGGALEAGNYMFASYLAEKADALARGLVGR
jgi:hypothetical protein